MYKYDDFDHDNVDLFVDFELNSSEMLAIFWN